MCLRGTRRYRSMPALALTSPMFIRSSQHMTLSIARVISTGFLSSLTVRIAYSFLHILNNALCP
jgi:alpha-beta hydrolase superfamily lysophospholipase